MSLIELLLIALGLSMDAFAVAVCLGLRHRSTMKNMLTVGLYFGIFQAIMPVIGYFAASLFANSIVNYDHWIAFAILSFLGIRMIIEAVRNKENGDDGPLTAKHLLPLAVATSIDALAVGISFAFLDTDIVTAAAVIGVVTFAVCAVGIRIGSIFGSRIKKWAGTAGGIILILIGCKILLEHTGVIGL
ncbi:MAG: manganese efflux pump MntP family protein [Methanomassiliicoccaceae archaeon]|nr:manganese efflux pump MntP family protein [Methanomassiliicoccaceae archaeon]